MSNPVITRLGINQFWYRHWYSDKLFSENLQQDTSFTTFVKFYLDHGLTHTSYPFIHEYWYKPTVKKLRTSQAISNMRFYRRFFYSNDVVDIEHSFLLRNHSGEYFPMRMWIFRYLNWIILSVQWFKPIKSKKRPKSTLESKLKHIHSLHEHSHFGYRQSSTRRLKILIHLFLIKFNQLNKEYFF
jgi:hypothetical protein